MQTVNSTTANITISSKLDLDRQKNNHTNVSNLVSIVDQSYLDHLDRLGKILNELFVRIVYNYTRDVALQNVIQLDADSLEIFHMAEGVPYELGMYSPNFVFDFNSQPRIDVINCIHPMKIWMDNYSINTSLKNTLTVENALDANCIPEQDHVMNEFINRYDTNDTIFIIKGNSKHTGVDSLKEFLAKENVKCTEVLPKDIVLVDGQLKVGDQTARQFYLDLDKEDLKSFGQNILKAIIHTGRNINDVRTILLIQDKRMLSVLSDISSVARYINEDDYAFLSQFLIPTFTLYHQNDRDVLFSSSNQWRLKHIYDNTQQEIVIKSKEDAKEWGDFIANNYQNYVVQPYFDQKQFPVKDQSSDQSLILTGDNLFFNAKSYGPGAFREKKNNEVSLFLPALLKDK